MKGGQKLKEYNRKQWEKYAAISLGAVFDSLLLYVSAKFNSVVALGQTAPEVHILFSSIFNKLSQYFALYCAHVATEKITLTSDIEFCIWKKERKVICSYFWWICLFLHFKYIDCHHPLSSGPVTHEVTCKYSHSEHVRTQYYTSLCHTNWDKHWQHSTYI